QTRQSQILQNHDSQKPNYESSLIEIMDNNMPDCLDMFGKVGYTVFGPLTQYKGNANYLAVPKEKVSSLENVLKRFDIYSKHSSST
ncbi:MAG: hypothetical protein QXR28_03065, partial [Nitrososphaerota archaeon]